MGAVTAALVAEAAAMPSEAGVGAGRAVLDRLVGWLRRVFADVVHDLLDIGGDMQTHILAKTESRQVLGVMNDFAQLAEHHQQQHDKVDLVDLSLWLAAVPCSPLYKGHVSPDRALQALLSRPGDTGRA